MGKPPRPSGSAGFTLIELVVVLAILGILGTLVAVNAGAAPVIARQRKVELDVKAILAAAQVIEAHTGVWPETIGAMVSPRASDGTPLVGLTDPPLDPWGRDYEYQLGDGGPTVRCLGRDGREGGEGEDRDVVWPRPPASGGS